jgi:hypothetical protein
LAEPNTGSALNNNLILKRFLNIIAGAGGQTKTGPTDTLRRHGYTTKL